MPYTWQNAIDQAQRFIHGIPVTNVDAEVADQINSVIWTSFPWPWTQAALTAVSLTNDVQDFANGNNDFLQLLQARITRTDTDPDKTRELTVTTFLTPDLNFKGNMDAIQFVAHLPITDEFRFDRTLSIATGVTLRLDGEYQTTPTLVTDALLGNAANFPMPDRYFNVAVEGCKWKLYQLSDDQRAGTVVIQDRRPIYTGQLGVFMGFLELMKRAEDTYDALDFEFPDVPLGVVTSGGTLF